jgi:multiple sugar transport system ATP-binding protein
MASLSLKQVRKSYDGVVDVIKGVDLEIRDGEFMVFVGPSGCGKSTLLRTIAGLEDADSGELFIGDQCVNDVSPSDRGVAMVFQSYALYPHMTVGENMGFALKMAKRSKVEVAAAVGRAAEILQITALLDRKPKELSGGQRQRVAIGRAIVRQPKVFLFDEPLSNLDAALRVQMRTELARLHRELGTTMIYVTHDQVEAMTLGQRIAVFNGGRIAQVGEPMDLYDRPANLFVAGFLGSPKMNLVPVTISANDGGGLRVRSREGRGEFALGRLGTKGQGAPAVGADAMLGFRPDAVELVESTSSPGSNADGLQGQVDLVERLGDATLVHVNCAGQAAPLIVRLAGHAAPIATGSVVALRPDLARSRLFDSAGDAFKLSA